ncbi:MAG: TlpA family protein disulfide reductase [Chitinophaga sp.]|uniref:TlpA family protein disulfide reductase n=1 Tax=Chitinophaga sp. TaxID=1869181 RepID=UPI001B1F9699|nr:TlpA disulfide reductase family protein [Chitinophaga sp.]MBO9730239.1 TlpA family protein disulfide reductase [Chitinophaga sp.]
MKKIFLWSILLFPLTGFCQEQPEQNIPDSCAFDERIADVMTALKKDSVKESEVMDDFNAMNSILRKDIGEIAMFQQLRALDMVKDSAAFVQFVTTKPAALQKKKLLLKLDFIKAHPDSWMSLYMLDANNDMYTAASYPVAYEALSERMKQSHLGQQIHNRAEEWKKASPIGKQAIDFTRKNQFGKTIKLSDYRGKLVMLDFWGSWCGACRQSHPHIREVYDAYKGKGLEVIAIANENSHGQKTMDARKAAWLGAIKKDEANWIHVLNDDMMGGLDIIKAYEITSYPTKILVDKDGKILMRVSSVLNAEMDSLIKSILDKQ